MVYLGIKYNYSGTKDALLKQLTSLVSNIKRGAVRKPQGSPPPQLASLPLGGQPVHYNVGRSGELSVHENNVDMNPFIPFQFPLPTSLTQKSAEILRELYMHGFQGSGLLMEEIIKQQTENPNDYSFETVMVALVSKLDNTAKEEEEEYNKQMDAAILLSEGERENIQARKKRRIDEMESDCSHSMGNIVCEEFESTILLKTPSSSSSSSSSSSFAPKNCVLLDQCITFLDRVSCRRGNDKNNTLNIHDTSVSSSRHESNSTCFCTKSILELRKFLVKLLLLERDAIKWWKKFSYQYILKMGKRLDMLIPQLSEDMEYNSTDINSIVHKIVKEIHDLQCALYECPLVDGSAPKAFIDADPTLNIGDKFDVNLYSIEEDGFEVIEKR